jgi:hypothetical protein
MLISCEDYALRESTYYSVIAPKAKNRTLPQKGNVSRLSGAQSHWEKHSSRRPLEALGRTATQQ